MLKSLERSQMQIERLGERRGIESVQFSFREGSKQRGYKEFLTAITPHIRKHRLEIKRLAAGTARPTARR